MKRSWGPAAAVLLVSLTCQPACAARADLACDAPTIATNATDVMDVMLGNVAYQVDHRMRAILLSRVANVSGIVLILLLHALRCFFGFADMTKWRAFFLHVVVLSMFISEENLSKAVANKAGHKRCPILASTSLLTLDAIIHSLVSAYRGRACPVQLKDLKVRSHYMQVSQTTFLMAVFFFVVQTTLVMTFIEALAKDSGNKDPCNVSFLRWCTASVLAIVAGLSEMGHAHDPDFWSELLKMDAADKIGFQMGGLTVRNRYMWMARRVMCFVVNHVFRMIILGLSPIMLCTSHSMDFVKDSLAIFFMTKLDDVAAGRSVEEEANPAEEGEGLLTTIHSGLSSGLLAVKDRLTGPRLPPA